MKLSKRKYYELSDEFSAEEKKELTTKGFLK